MDPVNDLAELLDIAWDAAEIGRRLMTTTSPGRISAKSDRDLVTELDVRIQHEIRDHLRRATPGFGFLGEEDGGGVLASAGPVWVLDPIDGTSNFAHGLPLCVTSLGLVDDGEAVVGVVVAPFLGLAYHAMKDGGAYVNDARIHARTNDELGRAIVSLGDYDTGPDAAEGNRRRFAITRTLAENVERVRMVGSAALDLVWVADGRTDACVMLSNKPWDTAAGVVIAREAGAVVTDLRGAPHTFSSGETVAISPKLADPLRALLARATN
ncbi:inositol monophosphatase family protein [Amycolatopsis cynarae]|uniref:inositol-phosphate phosphatase n=1 Tax=Amycolatopsis cynarae TaxID=2995223 RepID=A0ABY7B131_9PSEU|nr:inositol monophosphatase family protein [Amycolatopsis sp. HUAS 11-8]WAL65886.1 inositol monophosphatase family protein [Amycolatopsis sp. HUAS 11-8]